MSGTACKAIRILRSCRASRPGVDPTDQWAIFLAGYPFKTTMTDIELYKGLIWIVCGAVVLFMYLVRRRD